MKISYEWFVVWLLVFLLSFVSSYIFSSVVIQSSTAPKTFNDVESNEQIVPLKEISKDIENNEPVPLIEQTVPISGVQKYTEVNYNTPIKLVISGVQNTIKVVKGTQVNTLVVSGVGNTVYLPIESSPIIIDSGVSTNIIYY